MPRVKQIVSLKTLCFDNVVANIDRYRVLYSGQVY